jgi:hypothetical protein
VLGWIIKPHGKFLIPFPSDFVELVQCAVLKAVDVFTASVSGTV